MAMRIGVSTASLSQAQGESASKILETQEGSTDLAWQAILRFRDGAHVEQPTHSTLLSTRQSFGRVSRFWEVPLESPLASACAQRMLTTAVRHTGLLCTDSACH